MFIIIISCFHIAYLFAQGTWFDEILFYVRVQITFCLTKVISILRYKYFSYSVIAVSISYVSFHVHS